VDLLRGNAIGSAKATAKTIENRPPVGDLMVINA